MTAKRVGRYLVLHSLGAGPTGVVYAAYDPELDRRVAVKLLHPSEVEGTARLLREARAMARLSHPNIIGVHDVGTLEGQVFIATDYVEGRTLAAWLKEPLEIRGKASAVLGGGRGWREILRVFVLAGRGLAAAHAGGVVHRDFKPDNVLIGDDSRVLVTDFGLARAEQQLSPAGSLAYAAPEQLREEKAGARADQFSFAVALYEALYGERPFAGKGSSAQLAEIEARRVRRERDRTPVPGWIRRVLLRGLAADPEQRHPTMEAMVDALQDDRSVRWRRLGAALGVFLFILGSALLAHWQNERAAQTCRGGEQKLQGVWDQALREKGRAAFAASKLHYAEKSWARPAAALDRYAADWTAMRTEACEATAVRHTQSPELLDLRISCLDDRLRSLAAVGALLASADNHIISRAVDLVSGLPALSTCADEAALRAPGAPLPWQRPAVDELRGRLAKAGALSDAGKLPMGVAKEINQAARQLGYAPVEAEALFALGRFQDLSGDPKAAQETLAQAAATALGTRSDSLLADAWTALLQVDLELMQLDAAKAASSQATAAVLRLGDPQLQKGRLLIVLGDLAQAENKLDLALQDAEQAVALLDNAPGPSLLAIGAIDQLAAIMGTLSRWPEALALQRRGYEKAVAEFGPDHPKAGEMEAELGGMLGSRELTAEARPHLEHALTVLEDSLGPDDIRLASVLNFLADNSIARHPAQAITYLQRALRIQGADQGEEKSGIVQSRLLLGVALEKSGRLKSARKELEQASAMEWRLSRDPDDLLTAMVKTSLGEVLIEQGDLAAAHPILDAALAAQMKAYGPDHPAVGDVLVQEAQLAFSEKRLEAARRLIKRSLAVALRDAPQGNSATFTRELLLAEVELAQGEDAEATPSLERLAAMPELGPDSPKLDRARARALLAQALWRDEAQRPRARQLAAQARDEFASRGARDARERALFARWLKRHREIASPQARDPHASRRRAPASDRERPQRAVALSGRSSSSTRLAP